MSVYVESSLSESTFNIEGLAGLAGVFFSLLLLILGNNAP